MRNDIITADDYSAFYMSGLQALVTFDRSAPRPLNAIQYLMEPPPIAYWGDNNTFPQEVIKDIRRDPEIGTLLDKQARLLYAGGLTWGNLSVDDGKEVITPLSDKENKEILQWLKRTNINRYLLEAAKDFYWFNNVFPEIVLSKDRSMVTQICVQPAEECRWSQQNPKTGIVEKCFINANWDFQGTTYSDEYTKKLSVIDPYYDAASYLQSGNETNYIYPLSYPNPGNKYYQLADWNSIRLSGWLNVSRAIPKFKRYLLEKQAVIKYHIEISDKFWTVKYPDWNDLSTEQKTERRKTELDSFQTIMTGAEQTGNNLFTGMLTDIQSGKEFSLWKINVIDDKLKSGQYLEEGKEASLYKMAAVGLHPALVGTMPNNGLGGAGSNIREAYNLHMLSVQPHQDIILEPLYMIAEYNGWSENLVWRFRNSLMTTLDKGKETTPNKPE